MHFLAFLYIHRKFIHYLYHYLIITTRIDSHYSHSIFSSTSLLSSMLSTYFSILQQNNTLHEFTNKAKRTVTLKNSIYYMRLTRQFPLPFQSPGNVAFLLPWFDDSQWRATEGSFAIGTVLGKAGVHARTRGCPHRGAHARAGRSIVSRGPLAYWRTHTREYTHTHIYIYKTPIRPKPRVGLVSA